MSLSGSSSEASTDNSVTDTGHDDSNAVERYDSLASCRSSAMFHRPRSSCTSLRPSSTSWPIWPIRSRGSGGTRRDLLGVLVLSRAVIERGLDRFGIPRLPDVIAMKMTKPSVLQRGTSVDHASLRSMSTELCILSEDTIWSHKNVISKLGTCRQRIDERPDVVLPVFVYEATELGDLRTWLPANKDVTHTRRPACPVPRRPA